MVGGPGLRIDLTSTTAPALASSVSSCMRKTTYFMTLKTSLTHPPKVSTVAELVFGVTARKKSHGHSSDTGNVRMMEVLLVIISDVIQMSNFF